MAQIIFVMVADSPYVGECHKFKVKHMSGSGTLSGNYPGCLVLGNISRRFSKEINYF
jgi:hypothetical protein